MELMINGEIHNVPESVKTVSDLLNVLGFSGKYVAVEVNRELIPHSCHATHLLHPGDQLEVVTLVGGG